MTNEAGTVVEGTDEGLAQFLDDETFRKILEGAHTRDKSLSGEQHVRNYLKGPSGSRDTWDRVKNQVKELTDPEPN